MFMKILSTKQYSFQTILNLIRESKAKNKCEAVVSKIIGDVKNKDKALFALPKI